MCSRNALGFIKSKVFANAVQAGSDLSGRKRPGKMGYEDFVWFIMSEEDKSSDMALDYWFKCCDLDGDGFLRANEMLVTSASLLYLLHMP